MTKVGDELSMLSLAEQYDGIVRCCDDLSMALMAEPPVTTMVLTQHRLRLSRLVQENLADEEQQVSRPLRRLPAERRPAQFAALSDEADRLRLHYSQHVQRWSLPAVEADRQGYGLAVGKITAELRDYLRRKRPVVAEWQRIVRQMDRDDTGGSRA